MSTVIITPLFPPDPSPAARYTKMLAEALQPETLIVFGSIPESVAGVPIQCVSKRLPRIFRAFLALKYLVRLKPTHLIVQNGPAAELPALLFRLVFPVSLTFVQSDHSTPLTARGFFTKKLHTRIKTKADTVLSVPTDSRQFLPPEWLPNQEPTEADYAANTNWWEQHLSEYHTL